MHQIARESASRLCGKMLQNKERSAASKITCCPSKKYTRKQIVALSGATSIERNCHSTLESAGGAEKIKNWVGRQSKQEVKVQSGQLATAPRTDTTNKRHEILDGLGETSCVFVTIWSTFRALRTSSGPTFNLV